MAQSAVSTIYGYGRQRRTTRHGLNLPPALARPLIKWNHDQVMRQGEGRLLDARLISLVHG